MGVIDEKTKIPMSVAVPAITIAIGAAAWFTSVAADARKGAKSADKVTQIYHDVKAIKRELKIKDEPVSEEE